MQAVDDAKKRAVGQHVDYETFKNMVRWEFHTFTAQMNLLYIAFLKESKPHGAKTARSPRSRSHDAHAGLSSPLASTRGRPRSDMLWVSSLASGVR